MRQFLAALLLFALGLPLVPPMAPAAGPEADLPACCRRDGKHQCAMRAKAQAARGSGFHASLAPCSSYRPGPSVPAGEPYAILTPAPGPARLALAQPLPAARRESRQPIAPLRSAQKRGPPSSFPA